jgi:ABC-type multidrug transport system ATPase subunit
LQWSDLRYTINECRWQVTGCKVTRQIRVKDILQPQSGELTGGTITALMGPSGAGELHCTL